MATSTAAAADPREELPVVVVFQRVDSCVTVQWGQDGADHTIGGLTSSYRDLPISFSALDSNGRVPTVQTFGSLLFCDGGILTIGETRYRIQVQQEQQQLFQQQHLPPRSPIASKRRTKTAPPSTGKESSKQTHPRKSPSSEEGRIEGLRHASEDDSSYMQCTSIPYTVALLEILETTIKAQQNQNLDDSFHAAAKYALHARYQLTNGTVPNDIGTNERFFTGAMANAINSVLKDGYCVLHQACLGVGSTHSDISATRIQKNLPPITLMVGEGKWNTSDLRQETRGQMFNELLRHRAIDNCFTRKGTNGPMLLFAFDKNKIEIDLGFPSTKGGKLEKDEVVAWRDLEEGKETFWTVQLLRMSIEDGNGKKNLPIVLRFISDALEKLDSWRGQPRVQHKVPIPLKEQGEIAAITEYAGKNVTIIEAARGAKFVYKEYCYHLRQASTDMMPLMIIEESDKRKPPPEKLLKHLGSPYSEWKEHKGPFGTAVLRYPFIEGNPYTPSIPGWLKILLQIQKMHEINFVHGDLLPRNVLFDRAGEDGFVIDFDLSREEGATYVRGYNYSDFQYYRHDGAKEGLKMMKEHDLHSLRQMSTFFFDLEVSAVSTLDLHEMIDFFHKNPDLPASVELGEMDDASGSPNRNQDYF